VRAGKTTILIGTGGVEQNGPYVAGGKHNFVLATVLPEIAKAIGNTLIAPIVKFVPEGAIEPDFLKTQGIVQIDKSAPADRQDRRTDTRNGMHDDIYYEAQAAVQDPKLIRAEQRIKAGLFTLHGVDLAPVGKTVELGRKLAVYRAGITARAFQNSVKKLRGAS
jgi:hypothetical protein